MIRAGRGRLAAHPLGSAAGDRAIPGRRAHAPAEAHVHDAPGVFQRRVCSTPRAGSGQALIETAITVPVLLTLLLSFLLAMVVAQAYVDVDTATSLAAAAAVSAPADNDTLSRQFAQKTYDGTLRRSSYLEPGSLDSCGGYTAGGSVTCTGHATVFLSRTPMAILQPLDSNWHVSIQASATGYSSRYRST